MAVEEPGPGSAAVPSAPALSVRELQIEGPGGAFQGLSFTVAPGEAVGVSTLGAGGLGRLIEVIAGLVPPAAGSIDWGSISSAEIERASSARERYLLERRLRLEVGLVAPGVSLLQNRTLEDNISLPSRYHFPAVDGEAAERTSRVIAAVGVGAEKDRRPAGLPAGVRRRAELARALVLEPKLLILNSAFAGMEREAVEIMIDVLRSRLSGGTAVLAAAPEPSELIPLCSRVLVLDGPRLAGAIQGTDLRDVSLLSNRQALLRKLGKAEHLA